MSNIEKVNINIKCCIFTLAYSWVHNRRGGGRGAEINGGKGGRGVGKFNSRGGVEEI